MGFFSCLCKGCHHPLLSKMATEKINVWMSDVVVLARRGTRIVGEYDGYGRVDSHEVFEQGEPCAYHRACWVALGKPEFDGESEGAGDQGWFFNEGAHSEPKPKTKDDVLAMRTKADAR